MVTADLITGFLGSGKTTFIRQYVSYFQKKGEKVCILENDYGAINVDMMMLSDLKNDTTGLEMVAGGCDHDCHIRRFRTKLITTSLLGYDRVIIEPSGVFDVDEFYDIVHEDSVYDRVKIGNVIAIVNADLEKDLSEEAEYLLASQVATSGRIILSRVQDVDETKINETIERINEALKKISCKRTFSEDTNITVKNWSTFTDEDFHTISHSSYQETGYIKQYAMNNTGFESLFFMNTTLHIDEVNDVIHALFNDPSTGNILRIKGFLQDEENIWHEINATKDQITVNTIKKGQNILIVTGEKLNEERIGKLIPCEYSTEGVRKTSMDAKKETL